MPGPTLREEDNSLKVVSYDYKKEMARKPRRRLLRKYECNLKVEKLSNFGTPSSSVTSTGNESGRRDTSRGATSVTTRAEVNDAPVHDASLLDQYQTLSPVYEDQSLAFASALADSHGDAQVPDSQQMAPDSLTIETFDVRHSSGHQPVPFSYLPSLSNDARDIFSGLRPQILPVNNEYFSGPDEVPSNSFNGGTGAGSNGSPPVTYQEGSYYYSPTSPSNHNEPLPSHPSFEATPYQTTAHCQHGHTPSAVVYRAQCGCLYVSFASSTYIATWQGCGIPDDARSTLQSPVSELTQHWSNLSVQSPTNASPTGYF